MPYFFDIPLAFYRKMMYNIYMAKDHYCYANRIFPYFLVFSPPDAGERIMIGKVNLAHQ